MANLRGVDCSQPISGAALAEAKMGFVFRYLSTFANPKDDGRAEVADHHANGIAEGLVFEDSNYSVSPGQAQTAVAHAQALGAPAGVAIFMACDENPDPASTFSDMVASSAVIRAAGYLSGWYGNKDLARQLQGGGHIDAAWVVDTWGQDTPTDRWNFRQLPNVAQAPIGGVDCDADDAPYPVGLWMPVAPAPTPDPTPTPIPTITLVQGDPDVAGHADFTIKTDANGAGWATVGIDANTVISVLVENADPAKTGTYTHSEGVGITAESVGITKFEVGSSSVKNASVVCRAWFTTGT